MHFDDWLKAKKENLGLTNADIAHELRVAESTVGKWVNGTSLPERAQVIGLSRLFRVSPTTILRMTDNGALLDEVRNGESQELAQLLASVPELQQFYALLAALPPEKRAALILLARAQAQQGDQG